MSNIRKCAACGGVFLDPQRDGSAYFHACPPIPNDAYQPDPAQDNYDPRETVLREGHRDERPIAGMQVLDGKLHVPTYVAEEGRQMLKPGKFAIVSEGKGRA